MRSVADVSQFASGSQKFNSGKGDKTFTIHHGSETFVVDVYGNVLSPVGVPLDYDHSDLMTGNQSMYTAEVKNFLTVDPFMDSPGSKIW